MEFCKDCFTELEPIKREVPFTGGIMDRIGWHCPGCNLSWDNKDHENVYLDRFIQWVKREIEELKKSR